MSVIVVTGSAGFIGSHVVEALAARGEQVVGVDNFDPFYDRAWKERNARDAGPHELVRADITDAAALRALFARVRPQGVIHLAAKAGVRPSLDDPVGYVRANVVGTAVVLQEAARAGCRRVLVASSSSVYGDARKVPFAEDDPVDQPISPYAASKRAAELLAHAHHVQTGMPVGVLRFFTVFGPRQRPDLAIMSFMRRLQAGREIEIFGDGASTRDYTFIDDVVKGVLSAYERVDRFGYRTWNLGSDRPVRLEAVIEALARVTGREPRIRRLPPRPGDVAHTWADLVRARAELGYQPQTAFEEGLARQWAWLQRLHAD